MQSSFTRRADAVKRFGLVLLALAPVTCRAHPSSGPEVGTDLAKLKTQIKVPNGVSSARWLVRRFPSSWVPGPNDRPGPIAVAFLETRPRFWSDQGYLFSPGATVTRGFFLGEAKALFPAALIASGTVRDGQLEIDCVRLAPEVFGEYRRIGMALRCGDGIVVSFQVRP
jgi:hypothetical protein